MDGGEGGRVQQEQDRYKSITSHHYNVLGGLRGPSKRGAAAPPPPPAAEEAEDGGGFGCEPPLATLRLPLLAWRYSGMAAVGFLGSIVRLGFGRSRAEQSESEAIRKAKSGSGPKFVEER